MEGIGSSAGGGQLHSEMLVDLVRLISDTMLLSELVLGNTYLASSENTDYIGIEIESVIAMLFPR